MIVETLKNYGFSRKEAKVYLASLELGNAIVSSIARHSGEHRITTYSILKDFNNRGIAQELTKNGIKYFSVIGPKQLLEIEEKKVEKLKEIMPELSAMANAFSNKPKVYFYEGIENLKNLFLEIVEEGKSMKQPYLSFAGTKKIDKKMEKFLEKDFKIKRDKIQTQSKIIISDTESVYNRYHKEAHNIVTISDPVFEMGNEIVLYGSNKVGILNYSSGEIYGLVIQSETLFKTLESIFNIIWKTHKK